MSDRLLEQQEIYNQRVIGRSVQGGESGENPPVIENLANHPTLSGEAQHPPTIAERSSAKFF